MRWTSPGWLVGLLGLLAVAAGPGLGVALRPAPLPDGTARGFFDYRLAPGAQVEDAVLVTNLEAEPVTLRLFPSEARTAANGGLVFPAAPEEAPRGAGAWLQLAERSVSLAAGETRRVSFRLAVPPEAAGEYLAGIVARREALAGEGALPVTLVAQAAVTVRVWVAAPGLAPAPRLRLAAAQVTAAGDAQTLVLRLANDGTVGVKGEGRAGLRSAEGLERKLPLSLGYVLAGDAVSLRLPLEPPLVPGPYHLTLALQGPRLPWWTAERDVQVPGWSAAEGSGRRAGMTAGGGERSPVPLLVTVILLLLVVVAVQGWWLYRGRR